MFVNDLVHAVRRVSDIRDKCREVFETCFTADTMAANYERIYYHLSGGDRGRSPRNGAGPGCIVAAAVGEKTPG